MKSMQQNALIWGSTNRPQVTWATSRFNWDKKDNHSNACCNLKGLIPVGNSCLMTGENIPEISQDCVLCTYYLMFFQKIKKKFELWSTGSEVSTLILADASGPMVWSTDAGIHKIDGSTLKPFSMVQAIRSGKKSLPGDLIPPPRLYRVSINVFIQSLSKIAVLRTMHP